MNRKWIFLLIALVLLLGLGLFIGTNITSHQTEQWVDQSWKKESSLGRQFTLSTFLKKQYPSIKQEEIDSDKEIENLLAKSQKNAVLFVFAGNVDEHSQKLLLDWASSGNHLVIAGEGDWQDKLGFKSQAYDKENKESEDIEALYARLASHASADIQAACLQEIATIKRLYPHQYQQDIQSNPEESQHYYKNICPTELSRLQLRDNQGAEKTIYPLFLPIGRKFLSIETNKYPVLLKAENQLGYTLLKFSYGSGSVTVLNDLTVFERPKSPFRYQSSSLIRFDNPYLAAYLSHEKSHIYFISRIRKSPDLMPSWLKLIKKYPLIALATFLLLFALIWQQFIQTGGRKKISELENRQLYTHLYAQGLFVWRHKQQSETLIYLQKKLWQEWQILLRPYQQLNFEQKINILHQLTGCGKSDLALWLKPITGDFDTAKWLHYIRTYQRIRKFS